MGKCNDWLVYLNRLMTAAIGVHLRAGLSDCVLRDFEYDLETRKSLFHSF